MEIFTIGFAKKSAEEFFEILGRNGIKLLIDVRLKNTSQMAGFTKMEDLRYFLKQICDIEYIHEPSLAPTREILDDIRKNKIRWEEYEARFIKLLSERGVEKTLDKSLFESPTVLLCSEPEAEKCHRRLVAEYLRDKWGDVQIVHL